MRFAVAAALFLLAACQPLPRPFAQDVPPPNSEILTPPDSAGVMVEAIDGAPEPAAHDLAGLMAKALQDDDVPASTAASNRGSYRLTGKADAKDVGNGNVLVTIAWQMHDSQGVPVSRQDAALTIPATVWRQGGKGLTELARQSAPFLAKMVESTAPAPLASSDPLIGVRLVTGAPGDGGESLTHAMADALRRAKLVLAEKPGDKPNFFVQGEVAVAPPAGGKQEIKISWSLLRPDGGQIGQVKQENAVPAGSLDGPWGLTAYDVANAAAPGIAALIAEIHRTAAPS